jgi:hypothetical protein
MLKYFTLISCISIMLLQVNSQTSNSTLASDASNQTASNSTNSTVVVTKPKVKPECLLNGTEKFFDLGGL